MTDLQCPARLILLSDRTDASDPVLRERLGAEAVGVVYTARQVDPVPWVRLADAIGATWCEAADDLADGSGAVREVIDRHRGEAVVLVRRVLTADVASPLPILVLVDADGEVRRPL